MIKTLLRLGVKILPILVVVLVVLELVVTNELASLGEKVNGIEVKIGALQEENELLSQEVASASSLLSLASRAKDLGFVEAGATLSFTSEQLPVALNQPH